MGGSPDSEIAANPHRRSMTSTMQLAETATPTTAPISVESLAPATIPAPTPVAPATPTKGWHEDPLRQHDLRWHNGIEWTEHVTHYGPVPCRGCNSFVR